MFWVARYMRCSVVQECDSYFYCSSSYPNSANGAVLEFNRESQSLPVNCMGGMAWAARYMRCSFMQERDSFFNCSSSYPNSANAAVFEFNRESQSLHVNCMDGMAWAAWYMRCSVVQDCDSFFNCSSSKPKLRMRRSSSSIVSRSLCM
ncbi:unnamed protein product [Polarella glacialis]|uniref:Uncharacterized protein n=1 Tax=Polarella glacialis TaxID=89957 RepID=A0A813JBM6_POLGL|nr:unnamed protein product [Polarella glacialis]